MSEEIVVPLVVYIHDERHVIGAANIRSNGWLTATINNSFGRKLFDTIFNQEEMSISFDLSPVPAKPSIPKKISEKLEFFPPHDWWKNLEQKLHPNEQWLREHMARQAQEAIDEGKLQIMPEETYEDPAKIMAPMFKAMAAVVAYVNDLSYSSPLAPRFITTADVKLVWYSKTLENWKAMVITTLPDKLYYEVTYSGANKNTCVDVYQKIDSVLIPDQVIIRSTESEDFDPEEDFRKSSKKDFDPEIDGVSSQQCDITVTWV